MSDAHDLFRSMLKRSGCSITRARVVVFRALLGREPMSMPELIKQTRGVDRASVYRTIELFERVGIVQRLHTGWKYKLELTDKFAEHHHHLTCTRCGQTIPMNEDDLELFIDRLARKHAFTPLSHQIEIQGTCHRCRHGIMQQLVPAHL